MFTSRHLDRLTRVHPVLPLMVYLPIAALLLAIAATRASLAVNAGLFGLGYLAWTLAEYWLHRLVFHGTFTRKSMQRLHWMVHGVHHDHPRDPRRLVFSPIVSLPIGLLLLATFRLLLGTSHWAGFAAGFVLGYLAYDMLHYHIHHGRPRTRILRGLRRRHMRHHFHDEKTGFGVSAPFWDHVFGTAPGRFHRWHAVTGHPSSIQPNSLRSGRSSQ